MVKRVALAVVASFALLVACGEQNQQPKTAEMKQPMTAETMPAAPAYTPEKDKGIAAKAADGVENAAESTKETAEDVAKKTGELVKEEAKNAGANVDKAAENSKEIVKGAVDGKENQ